MSKGLMWQPATDKLADEIQEAAQRFEIKFGKCPNACRMRNTHSFKTVWGMQIIHDETITPGHFLLTLEEIENET